MLDLTPITLDEANAFVSLHHRHHKPVPGAKFCIAVSEGDTVRGVAIVGRPVARRIGMTAMIGGKDKTRIRNATPPEFRGVLLAIAATAKPPNSNSTTP